MRHWKFLPGRELGVGPEFPPTGALPAEPIVTPAPVGGVKFSAEATRDCGARGLKVQPCHRHPSAGQAAVPDSAGSPSDPGAAQCAARGQRDRCAGRGARGCYLRHISLAAGPDSLTGCPRLIVSAEEAGAAVLLAQQPHRGLKEILKQPPIRIEGIERLLRGQGLVVSAPMLA